MKTHHAASSRQRVELALDRKTVARAHRLRLNIQEIMEDALRDLIPQFEGDPDYMKALSKSRKGSKTMSYE